MSVQTALVAIKTANSTLNTLVSTRFHPDKMPQKVVFPAVCFQVISRPNTNAFGPAIANYRPRVQMDGYTTTSALRTALRTALVNAFYGYSGTIGGETIKSILIDNERETVEMFDTETEAYRISIDFRVDL